MPIGKTGQFWNGTYVTTDTVTFGIPPNTPFGLSLTHKDTTPSAFTFVTDFTGDIATAVAHGAVTGLKGRLTTTDTLPDGLQLLTDYYLIVIDVDTIKFATSLFNAQNGIFVDFDDDGVGVHTFTPTTASMSIAISFSGDGINYTAAPVVNNSAMSVGSISPSGSKTVSLLNFSTLVGVTSVKVVRTVSAGQLEVAATFNSR